MIKITQFDGQYTEADIAVMNQIALDVLNHFEISTEYFSAAEVAEITRVVESEVAGRFIDAEMGCAGDYADLLPANWRIAFSRTV